MDIETKEALEYINRLNNDEKMNVIQKVLSRRLPEKVIISMIGLIAFSHLDKDL